jgi:hypothetical protein
MSKDVLISMSRVIEARKKDIREKLVELYKNYGIDIGDINDEEVCRLIGHYIRGSADIEEDFLESQRHSDKFSDEDLI